MTCDELIATYVDTLKGTISCKAMPNGRLSLVMPFVYPDHDNVEVFVKATEDKIVVSDLGETLRRLDSIGLDAHQ